MGARVDSDILWTTTRTRKGYGTVRFTYTGGMYIDVAFNGHATDVINVMDYRDGSYRVSTREDFTREVREYMADAQNLADQFENARYC